MKKEPKHCKTPTQAIKVYTREEVLIILNKYRIHTNQTKYINDASELDNWIETNF